MSGILPNVLIHISESVRITGQIWKLNNIFHLPTFVTSNEEGMREFEFSLNILDLDIERLAEVKTKGEKLMKYIEGESSEFF